MLSHTLYAFFSTGLFTFLQCDFFATHEFLLHVLTVLKGIPIIMLRRLAQNPLFCLYTTIIAEQEPQQPEDNVVDNNC